MEGIVFVDLGDLKMYFALYGYELVMDDCFDFLYNAFIDVMNLYNWGTQNALYQFLTTSSYAKTFNPNYVKVPQDKFEDLIDLPEYFYVSHQSYWKAIYRRYASHIESIAKHNNFIKKMQKLLQ